ncbi:stage V sporulation protein M [Mycoplasmatota bacterium]|nr:stage V sporulation protein M [Mycoplasmatota bacterium]
MILKFYIIKLPKFLSVIVTSILRLFKRDK